MSITVALVIATFMVCVTILAYRLIEVYQDERVKRAERREEQWETRYHELADTLDKLDKENEG